MGKKILLPNEIIDIINKYQNEAIGIEGLAKEYGVGKLKIKSVLENNGLATKKRGGQIVIGNSSEIEKSKVTKYTSADSDKKLVAVCKKTGKRFNDVNNASGNLTLHILSEYGNVPIPTNTYQRKKYEIEYGHKWFEEYFDIISDNIDAVKKCPYCDWETTDVNNLSGQFQVHLSQKHNLTIEKYISEFPNEINYFSKYKKAIVLNETENHIICKICGKKLGYLTDTHLKKHNISMADYRLMFPNERILSEKYKNKLIKRYNSNLKLHENKFTSKPQIEIFNLIKSLGLNPKMNDKKLLSGVEIDILIEEKKIGIEYNGLFYHTEKNGKDRLFHLNKTKLMNDKGYSLIQIFEDEWLTNKELISNKIKHILGYNMGIKVGARKCKIEIIDSSIKNSFLNKYHIQGRDSSTICLGAKYNDMLVGVMTFDDMRRMTNSGKEGVYELRRFATNSTYILPGVANKILTFFIKNFKAKSIISFGDRRWVLNRDSNLYTKLGFKLVNILPPDYKYYNSKADRQKRFHKFGFGKSALKRKYPNLDFSKTEKELTQELGYNRIWDCGLFKYELVI